MPVSNFTKLITEQLIRLKSTSFHRMFLVIEGGDDWSEQAATALFDQMPQGLWIGGGHPQGIPASKAKQVLGQSTPCVVFNAHCGFHPNAFAAVAGCVEAGGCLVLITPPLAELADFDCPDYERLSVHGAQLRAEKYFLSRLSRILSSSPIVWRWNEQGLHSPRLNESPQNTTGEPPFLSQEQADAVAAIKRVATGHRKRPLVMTADRGRGKSASLGFAVAALVAENKRVGLVAPNKAAVAAVFEFAGEHNDLLTFYSPDFVDIERPELDVLLVDEAAAIPVPMLLAWAQHYPRVVYSTTVQGYEGHGQGFVQRFLPALKKAAPQMRTMHLDTPIRWGQGCPVEALVNELLLLDVSDEPSCSPNSGNQPISYMFISQVELACDERLLRQIHGLLLSAHYQTTPDDVRTLLDGPNIKLAIARQEDSVVGVVMLAEEGELPKELHEPIFAGQRRVRGHLAPQFMTVNGTHTQWLGLRTWRVVRIAVDESYRRLGIGQGLIKHIEATACEQKLDAITTVFGWTPELLRFWGANGFLPQAFTTKRDSVTSTLTGSLVKPLVQSADAMIDANEFMENWFWALTQGMQWLPIAVILNLLAMVPASIRPILTERDKAVIHAFAIANKPAGACQLVAIKLVRAMPEALKSYSVDELDQFWQLLISNRKLEIGQKQQHKVARKLVAELLQR